MSIKEMSYIVNYGEKTISIEFFNECKILCIADNRQKIFEALEVFCDEHRSKKENVETSYCPYCGRKIKE